MTCIAVVRGSDGAVWMGADSSASRLGTKCQLADSKIASLGSGVFVGVSGDHYALCLLRHGYTMPDFGENEDAAWWVTVKFAPSIRDYLQRNEGWNYNKPEGEEEPAGANAMFVAIVRGRIFELSRLLKPCEVAGGYYAVGNGEDVALGALYALKQRAPELHPREMLDVALQASTIHRDMISPPFDYIVCG